MKKKPSRDAYEIREHAGRPLREARLAYDAGIAPSTKDVAVTRLSSKNQLTVPVALVRALGLIAGDEVELMIVGETLMVERRPQTWDEWNTKMRGALAGVPGWNTREGIDAWVNGERDSWER